MGGERKTKAEFTFQILKCAHMKINFAYNLKDETCDASEI